MKKLLLITLLLIAGCLPTLPANRSEGPQILALAANSTLPLLVEAFRQEGLAALQRAKDRGATEQEAREDLARVEDRWRPVWGAWDALRAAQDLWATSAGSKDAAAATKKAYCDLLNRWPVSVPAVPLSPVTCERHE